MQRVDKPDLAALVPWVGRSRRAHDRDCQLELGSLTCLDAKTLIIKAGEDINVVLPGVRKPGNESWQFAELLWREMM
jgi:hypothetical protein